MSGVQKRFDRKEVPTTCSLGGADLARLSPEEYLERTGVTPYLKDVITLLLENRPAQPVDFIQDYFKNVILGTSSFLRSYRYICFTERGRQTFMDNLAAAYKTLDTCKTTCAKRQNGGVSGADFSKLVKSLCRDFPQEHLNTIIEVLGTNENDRISFQEFAAGVNACLLYAEFFDHAEEIYRAGFGDGTAEPEQVLLVIRQIQASNCNLKMPTEDELATAIGNVKITYKQFIANLFTILQHSRK